MEKLAGENGYHHLVKVIFDEEQRAYFTIETKKQIQFLSKEQSEAYKEMAKRMTQSIIGKLIKRHFSI